jgi:hypothetical protein
VRQVCGLVAPEHAPAVEGHLRQVAAVHNALAKGDEGRRRHDAGEHKQQRAKTGESQQNCQGLRD